MNRVMEIVETATGRVLSSIAVTAWSDPDVTELMASLDGESIANRTVHTRVTWTPVPRIAA